MKAIRIIRTLGVFLVFYLSSLPTCAFRLDLEKRPNTYRTAEYSIQTEHEQADSCIDSGKVTDRRMLGG